MSRQLAMVGASVRAAAMSAQRAGFQPIAADRFADVDLGRIAPATRIDDFPAGLSGWFAQLAPRPAAWMYTGPLENHPALVDSLSAFCPLWGNPGAVLRQVRSPARLAEVLGRANLLFPETRLAPSGLPLDGSWLAKSGRGGGGSGVRRYIAQDCAAPFGQVYYQRCVEGEAWSAVFVATAGQASLLGIVQQLVGQPWLGAGEFQYCGAIGPIPCCDEVAKTIRRIGDTVAAEFGLAGLFGVDLVVDGTQVWTIEVNPRYPASTEVVEHATGVHAVALHAQSFGQTGLSPVTATRVEAGDTTPCGKAILFADRRVNISARLASWAEAKSQCVSWPRLSDVPAAGTSIGRAQPVLSILCRGTSHNEVLAQLRNWVASVMSMLYSY